MSGYSCRSLAISAFLPLMYAAGQNRSQHPQVEVFVYDYVGLPSGCADELAQFTETLLSKAAIDAHWILCRGVSLSSTPVQCTGTLQAGEIALRIVPNCGVALAGPIEVLGSAVAPGGYITIYSEAAFRTAFKKQVKPSVLMAYAVVHEITHLFLGPEHRSLGLMRYRWTNDEYLAMPALSLGFTKREREALQRSIMVVKNADLERILSAREQTGGERSKHALMPRVLR